MRAHSLQQNEAQVLVARTGLGTTQSRRQNSPTSGDLRSFGLTHHLDDEAGTDTDWRFSAVQSRLHTRGTLTGMGIDSMLRRLGIGVDH